MANFSGADDMLSRLKNLAVEFPDRVGAALRQEAELEATECKKVCPVDTGALRASIHADGPVREGVQIKAMVVAGGPAEPYALIVHEDLEAFHKDGQAKYIEGPLTESAAFMAERLAARLKL